jgi:hypothetical protein
MDIAVNKPRTSHDALTKRVYPILMSMYERNEDKVAYVISQSKHWKDFINKGKIHDNINEFTRGYQYTISRNR